MNASSQHGYRIVRPSSYVIQREEDTMSDFMDKILDGQEHQAQKWCIRGSHCFKIYDLASQRASRS